MTNVKNEIAKALHAKIEEFAPGAAPAAEELAAMLEYVEAQNAIADCFYFGQGVPRNYRKAVYWYRQATKQNHPYATESLANCYYRGEGVVQNFEEAMKYFEKAAQMDSIWHYII